MDRVDEAARRIRIGQLVAFPTETVYGLGANALDPKAVKLIFDAKGRPQDNPCIVHVCDMDMLRKVVCEISDEAQKLIDAFWPGPLTIIFLKSKKIPDEVTSGLPTVAVRMPQHPMALEFIRKAGVPIAAPSANKSGRPSPTKAAHVRKDFPHLFILDGGPCEHGLESTVVSLSGRPRILRQGAITQEELRKLLPETNLEYNKQERPESPGMKYKHYAPAKPLILFSGLEELKKYAGSHPDATILCMDEHAQEFANKTVLLGESVADVARNLFDALRTAEGTELLVLAVPRKGIGRTVMDRLEKAACEIR